MRACAWKRYLYPSLYTVYHRFLTRKNIDKINKLQLICQYFNYQMFLLAIHIVNPLRTVVAYMHHGKMEFDTCEQIAITVILSLINLKPPAFYSLQPSKRSYISALKLKPIQNRKTPLKSKVSNYYNFLITYLLFLAS